MTTRTHTIIQQLDDIQTYFTQTTALITQTGGSDRKATEINIGCNVAALDFLAGHTILPDLERLEIDIRHREGLAPYGQASAQRHNPNNPIGSLLHGCCDFLTIWLTRTEPTPDLLLTIKTIHAQARNAARIQTTQTWAIRCCTDDCGTLIRITDPNPDQLVTCPKCKHTLTLIRLLLITSSTQAELWLDPEAAAQLIGVTQSTLRKWARSGRLPRRNNMYDVSKIRNELTDERGTGTVRYSSA